MLKLLHVPYTYFPDPMGGTEFYVKALATELLKHQIISVIAAPHQVRGYSCQQGLDVYRFAIGTHAASAEGVADDVAAQGFREILKTVRPDIVHLHARTSAVSELLLEVSHTFGARTVVTYHSPTMTCMRGTMLVNGERPCDGVLKPRRCTSCVLQRHRIPPVLASILARIPARLGTYLAQVGLRRGPWLALRMRAIVENNLSGVQRFLNQADLVIAPCEWVAKLLLANGLERQRLMLCRQGMGHPLKSSLPIAPQAEKNLRIGVFTRLDPTKGVDVLLKAIRQIPNAKLEVCIYGVVQKGFEDWLRAVQKLAAEDTRIHFLPSVSSEEVIDTMAQMDLVIVPSTGMETGPLVVLEAFAAGIPVVGSNLGGIAELIKTGINGLLLPPGDVEAWADGLSKLASNPSEIQLWKNNLTFPRTMATVAAEMAETYRRLAQCPLESETRYLSQAQ